MKYHGLYLMALLLLLSCSGNDDETKKQRFLIRANEAVKQQHYQEAYRLYKEALLVDSCYSDAHNNLGTVYFKREKYTDALAAYSSALQCDPNRAEVLLNRANTYYELGEFYSALADLEVLENYWSDTIPVYFSRGLVQTKLRRYDDAVQSFSRAITLDSTNVELWVNRGTVYYFKNEPGKAEADLQTAMKIDALEPNIYNAMALIAVDNEALSEGLDLVDKALGLRAREPYFMNNRGFIKLKLGDMTGALEDINFSISADPSNGWAIRNKGWYYYLNDNTTEAIRLLEQAKKMDPYIDQINYFLARAYLKDGNTSKACDTFKQSVEFNEDTESMTLSDFCNPV